MSAFMAIGIRDIHLGELRLQALWDSVFGICGVFVDVLEYWARLSGTVHVRKGARDRELLVEAPEWLNNGPFYIKLCFQLFCVITAQDD